MDRSARETLFGEVTTQHMSILFKTAGAFGTPADRDDLVQEMLLTIWQALPSFDGRCKLSTFVYRVAHNRALDWIRSARRYGRKLTAFENEPLMASERVTEAAQTEQREWLYAIIRELPPLDRTVLLLHLDGLSHQEVGEITGLSANHIGVRMHRIKRWLSEQKGPSHDA